MTSTALQPDPQLTATSRPPQQPRRRRLLTAGLAVLVGVGAGVATVGLTHRPAPGSGAVATGAGNPAQFPPVGAGTGVQALRDRTRAVPGDPTGWTSLGFAVLEQARAGGDPALYAEAGEAFTTSLRVLADGNVLALAGEAALADARHDFAGGERIANEALALDAVNPVALGALVDALTEQGRYPQALVAAQRLDAARPGVPSFTRLSYQDELRGRPTEAIDLLGRAAAMADTPSEAAFARAQQGLLALSVGDVTAARQALTAGQAVAPDDTSLLHLSARIAWETGDVQAARSSYATLVARRPQPAWAAEQAEVLQTLGDTAGAATALDVARASYTLSSSSGVGAEGTQVLFEADHGSAPDAVRLGAELVQRAPSVGSLDAYAWALHRAGRDQEALTFADRALALGGRPALFLYHRGVIRSALSHSGSSRAASVTDAVADLRAALATDPHFSPLHAPLAVALLATLGARS